MGRDISPYRLTVQKAAVDYGSTIVANANGCQKQLCVQRNISGLFFYWSVTGDGCESHHGTASAAVNIDHN